MIALADLQSCFEGVIPSIVATAAADGTPNISYLSQVVRVDDEHIALSNQFFSKTATNIRENPRAAVLVVDAQTGEQYRLDASFVETRTSGPTFEHVRMHIEAAGAQTGMAGIFRLFGIDIYRVREIVKVPSAVPLTDSAPRQVPRMSDAARVVDLIAARSDVDGIIEAALDGLGEHFGYENMLLLAQDPVRHVLTTIASRGYERTGIGSEVPFGDGVASRAAMEGRIIRVSDLSRVKRFAAAISGSATDENRTRAIAVPGMPDAMSQIAVPLLAQGRVQGVLFAESCAKMAFRSEDETALTIVARQLATSWMLAEHLAGEPQETARAHHQKQSSDRTFRITYHTIDDSVFIDDEYVIKGVPGRLLMFFLESCDRDGRRDFTNRELRMSPALRLPEIKDNLETRLLLLRRRLEEKASPVRLVRSGRGRVTLEMQGSPVFSRVASQG
jgi:adenylate cyclase